MEIIREKEQDGLRMVTVKRDTRETRITLSLNLDGTGKASVDTGIGFFNHMLEGFARHGFFDLELKVEGDLEVDLPPYGGRYRYRVRMRHPGGIGRQGGNLPVRQYDPAHGRDPGAGGGGSLRAALSELPGGVHRPEGGRDGYGDGPGVFLCGQLFGSHEPASEGAGRREQPSHHGGSLQGICQSAGSGGRKDDRIRGVLSTKGSL